MHTSEKLPASKGGAAKTVLPSAMSPAAAVRGSVTPAAVLTLQRAVGNQAVSRALADVESVESVETPADILNDAMGSASRPIESGTLRKAQSFYQNDRLSRGRVHTGPLAQRAVAAFGAAAMTVGEHIFFGAGVEHDTATAFHEYGHLDKNTKGFAETGTAGTSGVPVTDPGQHSEREAANDGAAAAQGAEIAPSVVAQRAVRQGTATREGAAVQRARHSSGRHRSSSPREEEERHRRRRSRDDYYGDTDYDRYDVNYVTSDTMAQNPSGRRAVDQNTVMGYSAGEILRNAGRTPGGTAAHLHTGAAYALGDGLEGQTQRSSNLTPGSQATNLDHKRYEDSVASDVVPMLGVAVTGAGLSGSGSRGYGYDVYDSMRYEVRGPDGRRVVDSHDLDLHDYSSAATRRSRSDYPSTREIRDRMKYSTVDKVMDSVPESEWDDDYRERRRDRHRRKR